MRTGLLLLNLGTPDGPTTFAVGRYLRQFLMDKRVVNLPFWLRFLLVYGLILPTRTQRSKKAYQMIWTQQGSPLRVHSQALCEQLQQQLGEAFVVAIGMRYGNPSIQTALARLQKCEKLIILPLYPQYASASTGSSIEVVFKLLAQQRVIPDVRLISKFYYHPAFIQAQAELVRPYVATHEHILFSYHGLPEQPLHESNWYRAQCFDTTSRIATLLQLNPLNCATAFQSRLGKTPWIKPYSDEVLEVLAAEGVKRLAVVCPSFVADCLETLEEIGIRAVERWQALGGECLTLIPCLNATEDWCEAIQAIISPTNG